LSHESFDDSVENDIFVVVWDTFITDTDRSEVLSCFWNLFGEKLEHNSSFLSIFNLDVKEGLRILWIESWKSSFILRRNLHNFFVVNTLREEFSHSPSLRLGVFLLLSLDGLKILSELLV
jgi:hypothetical protein